MTGDQLHFRDAPRPADDRELATHKLPCDVQIGTVIFRAGVPLLQLVQAMRAYQQRAWPEVKP